MKDRVIILAGGPSSEAAISRLSAEGVCGACKELGHAAEVWELEGDWLARLAREPKEGLFVFIGLHGCPGEDGTVQGALELLGVPYQGSGVMGSAVAMDKVISRTLLHAAGVPVAAGLAGEALADVQAVEALLAKHGKIVVKPATGGSSVGVSLVSEIGQWKDAKKAAADYGAVLVEAFVPGRELTVAVLRGADGEITTLPVVEITTADHVFYDYTSKYTAGGSHHVVPAELPPTFVGKVADLAVKAVIAVDARGLSRVDFRYDNRDEGGGGQLVVLEVNTLPGMTSLSLAPDAARAAGMSYAQLVNWMIEDGKAWYRLRT